MAGTEVACGVAFSGCIRPCIWRPTPPGLIIETTLSTYDGNRATASSSTPPAPCRSAKLVTGSDPGARPMPRSIRPGWAASSSANCSATTSGAWLGSITPPEPTRIQGVAGGLVGADGHEVEDGEEHAGVNVTAPGTLPDHACGSLRHMDAADVDGDLVNILFTEKDILARLEEMASEIEADYEGEDLLIVGVLRGAVMVMADLARSFNRHLEMDWMAA